MCMIAWVTIRKHFRPHEKALAIWQQSLPPNHPDLAMSYNNIGEAVSATLSDYPKALSSHEKAVCQFDNNHFLRITLIWLSPTRTSVIVYYGMGDYPIALSSHQKALAIQQQSLPPNHPDLGMSYNNIGLVYYSMDDYPKALSSYEKALAIKQQALPLRITRVWAATYNNIALVHENMKNYSTSTFVL